MSFPEHRLRRLRRLEILRNMVRETALSVNDLIYPLFVQPGVKIKNEIKSMPGNYRFSIDELVKECSIIQKLGIPAVILFGIPSHKDENGSEGISDDGIVQQAIKAIKSEVKKLVIITDVCFCEYTDHGHCGWIKNGEVDNDKTLEMLKAMAVSHARAGADMVAPSDMMDGRIAAIRSALDKHGYQDIPIMSYAAKFASTFYGPFRDAVESAPQFGDRRSYQMDPANGDEALREVELDVREGADIVMIKPAMAYMDLIWRIKKRFRMPVAAYSVSGEYSMIKAAAQRNWIDEKGVVLELLTSLKRAGADLIITYFAKDVAELLNKK
jgi:porphobilinogen synthase